MATSAGPSDLQIKRVTLYKNDLGFFERSCEFPSQEAGQYQFRMQVPTASKSLVVDTISFESSGMVTVNFDIEKVEAQLSSLNKQDFFKFQVGSSFHTFLTSVVGSQVSIKVRGDKGEVQEAHGTITLIENVAVPVEGLHMSINDSKIVVLTQKKELHTLFASQVEALKFVNPFVQEQFTGYLESILDSKKPSKKATSTVPIEFRAYLTEKLKENSIFSVSHIERTAEWKCLYRIQIPHPKKENKGEKTFLSLFGTVVNPTQEDWVKVELTLVANELEMMKSVENKNQKAVKQQKKSKGGVQIFVQTLAGKIFALDLDMSDLIEDVKQQLYIQQGTPAHLIRLLFAGKQLQDDRTMSDYNIQKDSTLHMVIKKENQLEEEKSDFGANELAGLAEHIIYKLPIPVTIRSKESAMVPIGRWEVDAEAVLLYDRKINEINVLKALHLQNSTPLVLSNGSISVLEGGRFVSQSEFTPMLVGDDTLIPYGYNTTISVSQSHPASRQETLIDQVQLIKYEGVPPNGINIKYRAVKRTKYSIKNNSVDLPVEKFYIDHEADMRHRGFTILTKEKAIKTVTGFCRYSLSLKPQQAKDFEVEEDVTYTSAITITNELEQFLQKKELEDLIQQKKLDAQILEEIQKIIKRTQVTEALTQISSFNFTELNLQTWTQDLVGDGLLNTDLITKAADLLQLKAGIVDVQNQIRTFDNQIKEVDQNQERLRLNIGSLEQLNDSALVQRYLNDLNTEEDGLIKIRTQLASCNAEKTELDKAQSKKELEISTATKNVKNSLDGHFGDVEDD